MGVGMQPDPSAAGGQSPSASAVAGQLAGSDGTPPQRPHLVERMPDDAPLVLRPRVSRLLAFFGALDVGIPAVALLIFLVWVAATTPSDVRSEQLLSIARFVGAIVLIGGGFQLFVVVVLGMGNGPHLAAAPHGLWVQSRKRRRPRCAFLPWDAVDRIFVRRNRRVSWRLVCVRTVVPPPDDHLRVQLDARTQRMLFGQTFNASPFFCGRRADDVLAELSQLSGGRVQIG